MLKAERMLRWWLIAVPKVINPAKNMSEKITQQLKERNIEFSGIICYNKLFFFINGEKYVCTTSIDSQNYMILDGSNNEIQRLWQIFHRNLHDMLPKRFNSLIPIPRKNTTTQICQKYKNLEEYLSKAKKTKK